MLSIGVDFDGVIADSAEAKREWLLRNTSIRILDRNLSRSRIIGLLGKALYDQLQLQVGYSDTLSFRAVPGAEVALMALAKNNFIHVISSRGEQKIKWAKRWLKLHSLNGCISSVNSSVGLSKQEMAFELGCHALIDDDLRHLQGAAWGSISLIYFDEDNRAEIFDKKIVSANSWADVLMLLDRMGA